MRDMDIFHTVSGQYDPTAGEALSNLILEEKRAVRRKKNLQKNKDSRKRVTSVTDPKPYQELANAVIALAYSDYVDVLRRLERIPEPDATAEDKVIAKHKKRIDKLKTDMEDIEEFFYSPLFRLACNLDPDFLIGKAWEEAYK